MWSFRGRFSTRTTHSSRAVLETGWVSIQSFNPFSHLLSIRWPTQSTTSATSTPTTFATSSLLAGWSPRPFMTTSCWSATSPGSASCCSFPPLDYYLDLQEFLQAYPGEGCEASGHGVGRLWVLQEPLLLDRHQSGGHGLRHVLLHRNSGKIKTLLAKRLYMI